MVMSESRKRGDEIVLAAESLAAGYGRTVIVDNIRLSLRAGEIVTLIGPNGAGKSTVLKTIAGELRPVSGRILIDGRDTAGMSPAEMAKKVSVVSTERIRPELMTGRDVAAQGRYPYTGKLGLVTEEDKKIVEDALSLMRCRDFAGRDFNKLSDGQKQRILIARAIAQTPEIMLLDEPSSYLDIRYQYELEAVLKTLAERGIAVLMSLHELGMAMRVSNRLIGISGVKMQFSDTPDAVREKGLVQGLFDLSDEMYRTLGAELGWRKNTERDSRGVGKSGDETALEAVRLVSDEKEIWKTAEDGRGTEHFRGRKDLTKNGMTSAENVPEEIRHNTELKHCLDQIRGADRQAEEKARKYIASLAMPPGSLGELETIAIRLGGITGRVHNQIKKAGILVFCADNGVTAEGVSSAPREVTAAQAVNMTRRTTGMSSMAEHFGDDVRVVDVGIATPYGCPDIIKRTVRRGTGNIAAGPAMTRAEAEKAMGIGIEMADKAKTDGFTAAGIGEMGIGNTTTSSAVLSVLLGKDAAEVTGRGGGITDAALEKKTDVIRKAIAVNRPDATDPIDVIAKVGGLDIAAMCGAYLGCAANRLPAVCDGFISITAALLAVRICPAVRDFIFLSHLSTERGYALCAEELGLRPFLNLGMRLGEGSGCVPAIEILRAATAFVNGMADFDQAGIDDGYLREIRGNRKYWE